MKKKSVEKAAKPAKVRVLNTKKSETKKSKNSPKQIGQELVFPWKCGKTKDPTSESNLKKKRKLIKDFSFSHEYTKTPPLVTYPTTCTNLMRQIRITCGELPLPDLMLNMDKYDDWF